MYCTQIDFDNFNSGVPMTDGHVAIDMKDVKDTIYTGDY